MYQDNKDDFDVDIINIPGFLLNTFSLLTPSTSIFREPWLGIVLSTVVMGKKVGGMRPMYTSIITINIEIQQSTNLIWIMGRKMAYLRHIYTSFIIINTFYIIVKGIVYSLLIPKFISIMIITTIPSFITMKTFVNGTRSNI